MVNETSKAFMRRRTDNRFLTRWFVGDGIDIGSGSDPLSTLLPLLPLCKNIRSWDTEDGDAMLMDGVSDESFDFVHSSHCLEHLVDPKVALENWIRICKVGGFIIITIPDEDLYEQGAFPSIFNPDHKWTFTIQKTISWSPKSVNVLSLLLTLSSRIEVQKIELLDGTFMHGLQRRDQTASGIAESAIEIVLKKRQTNDVNKLYSPSDQYGFHVLVKREAAMGDVIMTTPILRRLRSELGKDSKIDVATKIPDVFRGNSDINEVNPANESAHYNRIINLDNVYENNPNVHVVDAYMLAVFGDSNFSHKETIIHHEQFQNHHNVDWSRAVTINAGTSNRNRTMPREFWDAVIKMLILENLIPVIVGRGMDERWPNVEGIVDLTNQLSIGQTAHIIGKSICFVSSDTGAMHIAGSTLTPMVTIFTSVHSQFRMPWRKGVMGWNVTPMTPHLECIGCNELSHCPRNDFACVEGPAAVQPMAVVSAVLQAIDKTNLA